MNQYRNGVWKKYYVKVVAEINNGKFKNSHKMGILIHWILKVLIHLSEHIFYCFYELSLLFSSRWSNEIPKSWKLYIVWTKIVNKAPIGFQSKHLLWGLNFLKQYTTKHNRHSILKSDEKTIRKWTWVAVELMSSLNVVKVII